VFCNTRLVKPLEVESVSKLSRCVWCKSAKVSYISDAVVAPWALGIDNLASSKIDSHLLGCAACGIQFFSRRFSASELQFLYTDYRGETYLERRKRWEPWYSSKRNHSIGHDEGIQETRTEAIGSFVSGFLREVPSLRIVDFGGDEGQFIPLLPNIEFAGVFDVSGRPVRKGIATLHSLEQVRQASPNMIMLCHVLEHLTNPRSEIETVLELLSSNGFVYLEVPLDSHSVKSATPQRLVRFIRSSRVTFIFADFVSQVSRFKFGWRSRFRLIKQSEHLQFFSLSSIEEVARSLDVKVLGSFTYTSHSSLGTPETLGVLLQKE
jgi:hypothetical protein